MLVAFDLLSERFFFRTEPFFLQPLFIIRSQRFDFLAPGAGAQRFTDQLVKLIDGYLLVAQLRTSAGRDDMQDAGLVDAGAEPFVNERLLVSGQYFRCIHIKKEFNLGVNLIDVLAAAAGTAAGAKTQFCM